MRTSPVALLAWLCCTACITEQPRIELTIPSPDGRFVVELHNEPSIDPPQQSLRIGRSGGGLHRVKTVSSDGPRWRGPSTWSQDSRHFAFAVVDRHVYVVDAETGRIVLEREAPGGGATHQIRALSFNPGGTALTVEVCERQSQICSDLYERLDGSAAESSGLRAESRRKEVSASLSRGVNARPVAPPHADLRHSRQARP